MDKLISNTHIFNDLKIVDSYIRSKSIILKDYLVYLLKDKHVNKQEHSKTLNLLIKRFEVSKKLFKSYDIIEVKKNNREYDDILSYPLFSLVLQKFFLETNNDKQKMIYLNSILKLNDILSSVAKDNIILFSEVRYSIEALKGEIQITKNYIC